MENKWNFIVNKYKQNKYASEGAIQTAWEEMFADSELFCYSKALNEISAHRPLPMGTKTVIPDIILRKDNKDICVVELKKHDTPFIEKNENQLISYLKQISCHTGLLICDKIYLYYLDFTNTKIIKCHIDFVQDSADGVSFMELFTKSKFETSKIKEFIENKNESLNKINEIHKTLTEEYVFNLIKDTLSKTYGEYSTNNALKDYIFKVERKPFTQVVTPIVHTYKQPHAHTSLLPNNKLGKQNAIKKLIDMGYNNLYDRNTTYACNNTYPYYPSNVAPNRFDNDLYFILDDCILKKCHFFKIPAKTYDIHYFQKIKYDGSAIIYIKYLDPTFKDIYSNLCLKIHHILSFDY